MTATLIAIAVFLITMPAFAIDPECEGPTPITVWPCYDGTCSYCTPKVLTDDGTNIATAVSCDTFADGAEIHLSGPQAPGVKITLSHTVEGDFPAAVMCDDGFDTSEATGLGRFSAGPMPAPTTLGPPVFLP